MGRANNLQTDELVAVEVEKYRCLYDKSYPGYKEKDRVINAWKAVDDSLGMEEGT